MTEILDIARNLWINVADAVEIVATMLSGRVQNPEHLGVVKVAGPLFKISGLRYIFLVMYAWEVCDLVQGMYWEQKWVPGKYII